MCLRIVMASSHEKKIAARVVDYVRSNPTVDNIWGIRQFWLGDPDMGLSLVERALQSLAADGFLRTGDEPLKLGGRVWYTLQAAP